MFCLEGIGVIRMKQYEAKCHEAKGKQKIWQNLPGMTWDIQVNWWSGPSPPLHFSRIYSMRWLMGELGMRQYECEAKDNEKIWSTHIMTIMSMRWKRKYGQPPSPPVPDLVVRQLKVDFFFFDPLQLQLFQQTQILIWETWYFKLKKLRLSCMDSTFWNWEPLCNFLRNPIPKIGWFSILICCK